MPRCAAPRTIGKRAAAAAATATAHGLGRWTGLSRGEVFCTGIRTISSGARLSWTLLARLLSSFFYRVSAARVAALLPSALPLLLSSSSLPPFPASIIPFLFSFVDPLFFLSFFLSPCFLYFRVGRLAGIRARAGRLPAGLSRLAAVRRDRVRELIRSRLDR